VAVWIPSGYSDRSMRCWGDMAPTVPCAQPVRFSKSIYANSFWSLADLELLLLGERVRRAGPVSMRRARAVIRQRLGLG